MRNVLEIIPTDTTSSYTPEKMLEAAAHYVVLGNASEAARLCGVPIRTVQEWTTRAWWPELIGQIRADKADELDAALTGLIHSAVSAAQDRINSGDHRALKDGTIIRVPVTARDATLVAAVAFDKRQISRNLPTSITESTSDKLRQLQEQLRTVSGRVIEHDTPPDSG